MNCAENLNNFNGEYMDDLLPSFYHYLQYAYFKGLDQIKFYISEWDCNKGKKVTYYNCWSISGQLGLIVD